jgi:Xaa-Pro aminopeptidase
MVRWEDSCREADLMDPYSLRREHVLRALRDEGVDGLLVTHPVNVTYLTGFSGDSSYLVLTPGKTALVSDGRFRQQIGEECPGLEMYMRQPSQTVADAAAKVLNQLSLRTVGFESGHLTVADLDLLRQAAASADWKPGRDRVERLRMVKDAGEIAQIREAIHIAERAFAMFRAMLRASDSEKELADAMELYVRRAGGQGTSFPPIVAVGPRAALPHAPPTTTKVAEHGLLLVDWGACGRFYKSDLTRILVTHNNSAFPGRKAVDGKLQDVYAVVLEAQARAIQALHPGVAASAVDAVARGVISAAGYGDYFSHSLGHGIGLQIHEAPILKGGNDTLLQAGMVVTVEPGIYLPDWGGVRIEDDVLITQDGCEVLTSVPKELASSLVEL